jgi:hypothetical protein
MLITIFSDGAGSKLKAVKPLPFEVTVNRVVTQAQLSNCETELRWLGSSLQVDRSQKQTH